MTIDLPNVALFSVAALMLLGSPGPGIAALVAIGKDRGFVGGLRFYMGLQVGLALAAALTAAGLVSVLRAAPFATMALGAVATAYLVWLAYRIATSPIGAEAKAAGFEASSWGGFLLGITNPKAYLAFASLMASYTLVRANASADVGLKWLVCVAIILVVDAAWLWLGVVVSRAAVSPAVERTINIAMGAAILATVVLAWV